MFVPFNELADHSRLWIFQAPKKIKSDELSIISDTLSTFTEEWNAHGVPLRCSFDIRYDQFIILAADEAYNGASGCSIDSSTRILKDLGQQLGMDLFDRTHVAFNTNDAITTIQMASLKAAYKAGQWNENTLTFNNLVGTKGELEKGWVVRAGSTWLKRYFQTQTVAG